MTSPAADRLPTVMGIPVGPDEWPLDPTPAPPVVASGPELAAPAPRVEPAPAGDDWLTGAQACSIENGEDCEACQ